ncbi:MAG: DUF1570 domain-containing protein [Chthoniobacterales bacterium]|nr:DUF1570 domain-containing protein [Chthoniobacterales bacterium]
MGNNLTLPRAMSLTLLVCGFVVPWLSEPMHALARTKARTIQTEHYEIRTDLEPSLADDLAKRLEAMHSEYARRLALFSTNNVAAQHKVVLMNRPDDVRRLTGMSAGAAGEFQPANNLLAAFLEGQGREELRKTLQHEGFHQFAHAAISKNIPLWLNEGLAVYFEEGIWTGDGFLPGQVPPHRIRTLKDALDNGRLIPFQKLMKISHEEWESNMVNDEELSAIQYNQSWAMVYFLVHGSNGNDVFRTRLIRMLQLLHDGQSGNEAFTAAFSANVDGFYHRFLEYLAGLHPTP